MMTVRFKRDERYPCPGPGTQATWEKLRGQLVILGAPEPSSVTFSHTCGSDFYWPVLGPETILQLASAADPFVCRHILDIGD